jgi:hypothetical protein
MTPEDETPIEKPPLFATWRTVYAMVLCLLAVYVGMLALFRETFS